MLGTKRLANIKNTRWYLSKILFLRNNFSLLCEFFLLELLFFFIWLEVFFFLIWQHLIRLNFRIVYELFNLRTFNNIFLSLGRFLKVQKSLRPLEILFRRNSSGCRLCDKISTIFNDATPFWTKFLNTFISFNFCSQHIIGQLKCCLFGGNFISEPNYWVTQNFRNIWSSVCIIF